MKIEEAINKICTFGSVFLLLYKTSYDFVINKLGIMESFISDPLGYIFTLLPIIASLFIFFFKKCDFGEFVIYIIKSVVILIGTVAEFLVITKFELYNIFGNDMKKWYIGIVIVIFIVMVEGIIIGFVDEGTFDDVVDYMVDGLPFHYCLFSILLGLQKTIIENPYLLEINNRERLIQLIILTILNSILYFIEVIFGVFLLWLIELL